MKLFRTKPVEWGIDLVDRHKKRQEQKNCQGKYGKRICGNNENDQPFVIFDMIGEYYLVCQTSIEVDIARNKNRETFSILPKTDVQLLNTSCATFDKEDNKIQSLNLFLYYFLLTKKEYELVDTIFEQYLLYKRMKNSRMSRMWQNMYRYYQEGGIKQLEKGLTHRFCGDLKYAMGGHLLNQQFLP